MVRESTKDNQAKNHSVVLNYVQENDNENQHIIDEIGLTKAQIQAFQEAFELFDKNGGGTIDASELQKTLADVGIYISADDMEEVMMGLDHDGNGEVDFEEFLNLMTSTDVFIATLTQNNDDAYKKRTIMFDALTEFMKKQALKGVQEIIGYYSKKYHKIVKKYGPFSKGAHVIGHYADGAKVIGLTDVQLYKQLKELTTNVGNEESPYAQNQYAALLREIEREKRRKIPVKPVGLGGPKRSSQESRKNDNRITLKVVGLEKMHKKQKRKTSEQNSKLVSLAPEQNRQHMKRSTLHRKESSAVSSLITGLPPVHRPGWVSQQISMINVDIRVKPGWTVVPIIQVNKLKKVLNKASDDHFSKVSSEKLRANYRLYRGLNTRKPPSTALSNRIKECMVDYSSATTNNAVGRIGHRILEKAFNADKDAAIKMRCTLRRQLINTANADQ